LSGWTNKVFLWSAVSRCKFRRCIVRRFVAVSVLWYRIMAKAYGPFFSLGAFGSVGSRLTARRRAGKFVLSGITSHPDSASAAQLLIRPVFVVVIAFWRSLSAAFQKEWGDYSPEKEWCGYAYFMHVNLSRAIAGLALLEHPPDLPGPFTAWEVDVDGCLTPSDLLPPGIIGLWELADVPDIEISPGTAILPDALYETDPGGDIQPLSV